MADEDGEKDNDILEGYCTFYDNVVDLYREVIYKPGTEYLVSQSIHTASNFVPDGRDKMTVGTKQQHYIKHRISCNVT